MSSSNSLPAHHSVILNMGNAHSTSSPSESRTMSRKYSAGISRLGGSCCYAWGSHTSSAVSEETVCNEKFNLDHSLPKHAPKSVDKDAAVAYNAFLKAFPEYGLTSTLDNLRESDFSRLDRTGETYVDYMGGAVYPESLIRRNTAFLNNNVLGNTHSVSNRWGISAFEYFSLVHYHPRSSTLSSTCADKARATVLSFFQAPPEYTVIFTSNATGALKLVGEAYPFTDKSTYILGADSHNSVHGIREFAARAGAKVCYIDSTANGGFVESTAKVCMFTSIYAPLFTYLFSPQLT
jgi:molybdenum cofactor sulfurtransferase